MGNWDNKEKNRIAAIEHTKMIENSPEMQKFVSDSIRDSIIISPENLIAYSSPRYATKILVKNIDCITGLISMPHEGLTAILDFASYKDPGGRFIDGAMAQEEAICHASNLYNVLRDEKFRDGFYRPNASCLNHALYGDNMIVARNIAIMLQHNQKMYTRIADVIVAAAPNAKAAMKYGLETEDSINKAIAKRVNAVMDTANAFGYENLVLGAFGCGVFGCDPETVALAFRTWLVNHKINSIKYILFAIPSGPNLEAFVKIFHR